MKQKYKHTFKELPKDYSEYYHVNLQTDKKTALFINTFGLIFMLALIALTHFAILPISYFFNMDDGLMIYFLRIAVMAASLIAYVILHELTHAAVMKFFGAKNLRFGFTGLYAFAGSDLDYLDKHAYLFVAMAPLVVWGIIFTILLIFVPALWFWIIAFLQINNIVGSVGDLFVTFKFIRMPEDILVKDTGIEMFVYSKK